MEVVVVLGCSSWEETHETPTHSQLLLMRKRKTSLTQDHLAGKKQRQMIASVSLRAEGAEGSASRQALLTLQVTDEPGNDARARAGLTYFSQVRQWRLEMGLSRERETWSCSQGSFWFHGLFPSGCHLC